MEQVVASQDGWNMQIIVPMSGFGERFRRVGFTVPKPLIPIQGKPIISHVIDLFPGEENLIFVCNLEHLSSENYSMEKTIKSYCPTATVVGITPHRLGPVHAVLQVKNLVDREKPVIVNYCDFSCYWDWNKFKNFAKNSGADGIIPAYKDFHPHSLGDTNYAYLKLEKGWVSDIQEKKPFTKNKINEFASSGTYYFKSGSMMIDSMEKAVKTKLSVNGEFYLSLAYKPILAQKKKIACYPLQHFFQWGTPEDVFEFNYWSETFKNLTLSTEKNKPLLLGDLVIPVGGLGQRFKNEGYKKPKPLIEVSGLPMVLQAMNDLNNSNKKLVVIRSDMEKTKDLEISIKAKFKDTIITKIDHVTDGQAITANIGIKALESKFGNSNLPLTIAACDGGLIYEKDRLERLIYNELADIIVWGIRGYPNAIKYPNMYGWVKEKNNKIASVSVKKPLSNPSTDPIILGTFTFRNSDVFRDCFTKLIERDERINGEFYIDSLLNDAVEMGLDCRLFEVNSFLCWGTPNDLKTFEYWQSCFHKWDQHIYSMKKDVRIQLDMLDELEKNAYSFDDFQTG